MWREIQHRFESNLKFDIQTIEVITNRADNRQSFESYFKIGRMNKAIQGFRDLEEYDIVFLEDNASLRSGKYEKRNWRRWNASKI
jgi:hypothetical protein